MKPRLLLVDDDVELLELLRDYLVADGFGVDTVHDGAAALGALRQGRHDLVVLDVTMPAMSGIEVLVQLRQTSTLPVLMLTARGDDAERIAGLELGADDYVPKPCTPRELCARIRAILKRTAGTLQAMQVLVVGGVSIWPAQRRATRDGVALGLTSTEFNLLEILARRAGRPVSKAELSEQALGRPLTRFDRAVDVHISSVRHKLGVLDDGRSCIQTVIRQGYQLISAQT